MRPWVLAAALAAAGCSNAAHEQQVQLRDLCQGFVPGTTTFRQASETYRIAAPGLIACRTDYATIGGDDRCPHDGTTSVCSYGFGFGTSDCSGPLAGGSCANVCELRSAGPASQESVICARQWVEGVF